MVVQLNCFQLDFLYGIRVHEDENEEATTQKPLLVTIASLPLKIEHISNDTTTQDMDQNESSHEMTETTAENSSKLYVLFFIQIIKRFLSTSFLKNIFTYFC